MTTLAKERYADYLLDPVKWVNDMLGATPEPWQADALRDIAQPGAHVACRSGHGVGKSTLDAWTILWFLTTHYPAKIPCTAPTGHQLEDILWAEAAMWYRKLPAFLQKQLRFKSDRIELIAAPQECFAVARTARADNPEALQGFHSDNLLFIIDEASAVPEVIFEVAQGALSTPGARILMTANPTRTSGYFYDAFHKMSSRWTKHHVPCSKSSRVGPHYAEDVALKYGRDSNVYAVRVDGNFPKVGDDVLIPLFLIEDAIARDVTPTEHAVTWGVDVARFGDDRCALAKRKGNTLLEPITWWTGKDTMETVGRILKEFKDTEPDMRPERIAIDVIGIGAGVVDRLREMRLRVDTPTGYSKSLQIVPVNVGETALEPGFNRRRDELWWKCREWLEARDCKMPVDDELTSELVDVTYKINSAAKIEIEKKEDMKKRGARSPDLADALCLTFALPDFRATTKQMERYKRQRDNLYRRRERNWKTL